MNSFFSVARVLTLVAVGLTCEANSATAAPSNNENPTVPLPDSGMDVVLESLKLDGTSQATIGKNIVNDDKRQILVNAMLPSQTQIYLVRIKNTGQNSAPFSVHLGGPLSPKGEATPWNTQGWEGFAVQEGDTKNILDALQSGGGWQTPQLKSGEETLVRLSIKTGTAQARPAAQGSFRIEARSGKLRDAVAATTKLQYITGLEWSRDGDEWHPLTSPLPADKGEGILLRVVTNIPDADWDDFPGFLPKWEVHEPWEKALTQHIGEMITVHCEDEGTVSFSAIAGTQLSGKIVIGPSKL